MDLLIPLDAAAPMPIYRQLADGLRRRVLDGSLGSGTRVPATRTLAETHAISRATVALAYDLLLSEGYLEARRGAGTFVSTRLPMRDATARAAERPASGPAPLQPSAFGRRLAAMGPLRPGRAIATIQLSHFGRPALEAFPMTTWRRLLTRHLAEDGPLDYAADAQGDPRLRQAIASYLARARAVRCDASQVLITSGSQQALDLVARLFLEPGAIAALEDPGYLGARQAFETQGATLAAIPVDAQGLQVAQLPAQARLVYVTPSHQFPSGVSLSLPRRLALLDWAARAGALVVEDDYDAEYRYGDRPLPALQGLDQAERVLYVGTFSKVLFPGLRLGYLVMPHALVPLFARAKWLADRQAPTTSQAALADFLDEGHLERHVRRMRTLYAARRAALVAALEAHFGSRVRILGEPAGMHLMIELATTYGEDEAIARCATFGVGVAGAELHHLVPAATRRFVLGFADHPPDVLCEAVARMAKALDD